MFAFCRNRITMSGVLLRTAPNVGDAQVQTVCFRLMQIIITAQGTGADVPVWVDREVQCCTL